MAVYTQQRVKDKYGTHVGTVHYRDGNAYTGSWASPNGQWSHGQDLLNKNSNLGGSYNSLLGAKDHTYGAQEYVRQDPVQSTFNFTMPEISFPEIDIPDPAPTIPTPMSIKGNAAGVKRKKSKGEISGASTKGTSQFNRSMFINPSAPISNINV